MENQYRRKGTDRRAGNERRLSFGVNPVPDNEVIIIRGEERRDVEERRIGWVNVSRWSSADIGIPVTDLG